MAPTRKNDDDVREGIVVNEDESAPNFDAKRSDGSEQDRVLLFTINGKDYYIPRKSRIAVALRYSRNARKHGERYAESAFLEEMLGEEAYEALIGYDDLRPEDLDKVIGIATKAAFGELEAPKATSKKGTRK